MRPAAIYLIRLLCFVDQLIPSLEETAGATLVLDKELSKGFREEIDVLST